MGNEPNDSLRNHSRINYRIDGKNASGEDIKEGCLQRIADACELMAKNFLELQQRAEQYKQWYYGEREQLCKAERKISALKGVITKLKKRIGE